MSPREILSHPVFTWICSAILVAAAGVALSQGLHARWAAAAAMTIVGAVALGTILMREKMLPAFGAMLSVAALANAAGYVFTLWHEQSSFDEAVHAFTSLAGMAAIGWLALDSGRFESWSRVSIFAAVMGLALILGVVWEVVEWIIGIMGDRRDTLIDLMMDLLGASAAGAVLLWSKDSKRRVIRGSHSG